MTNTAHKFVNFLHLSDLHAGMESQSHLWPTLRTAFFKDLRGLFKKTGPWDLVIFSGDLTQKGDASEYAKLSNILKEIWQLFAELGCCPAFFSIPGNHDLVRPKELNAAARVLNTWWGDPTFQNEFWKTTESEYWDLINSVFRNYTE